MAESFCAARNPRITGYPSFGSSEEIWGRDPPAHSGPTGHPTPGGVCALEWRIVGRSLTRCFGGLYLAVLAPAPDLFRSSTELVCEYRSPVCQESGGHCRIVSCPSYPRGGLKCG